MARTNKRTSFKKYNELNRDLTRIGRGVDRSVSKAFAKKRKAHKNTSRAKSSSSNPTKDGAAFLIGVLIVLCLMLIAFIQTHIKAILIILGIVLIPVIAIAVLVMVVNKMPDPKEATEEEYHEQ